MILFCNDMLILFHGDSYCFMRILSKYFIRIHFRFYTSAFIKDKGSTVISMGCISNQKGRDRISARQS